VWRGPGMRASRGLPCRTLARRGGTSSPAGGRSRLGPSAGDGAAAAPVVAALMASWVPAETRRSADMMNGAPSKTGPAVAALRRSCRRRPRRRRSRSPRRRPRRRRSSGSTYCPVYCPVPVYHAKSRQNHCPCSPCRRRLRNFAVCWGGRRANRPRGRYLGRGRRADLVRAKCPAPGAGPFARARSAVGHRRHSQLLPSPAVVRWPPVTKL
jgi:hypothetical protein